MHTPALAAVLPPTLPGPVPAGPTPARDGEPNAFARELRSASSDAAADGPEAAAPTSETSGATAADDDAADTAAVRTPGRPRIPTAAAVTTAATQAARAAVERWLAQARAHGGERGVAVATSAAQGCAVSGAAIVVAVDTSEAGATAVDGAADVPALQGVSDDEATAPEAAALLATLLPRPPEEAAAPMKSATDALPAGVTAAVTDDTVRTSVAPAIASAAAPQDDAAAAVEERTLATPPVGLQRESDSSTPAGSAVQPVRPSPAGSHTEGQAGAPVPVDTPDARAGRRTAEYADGNASPTSPPIPSAVAQQGFAAVLSSAGQAMAASHASGSTGTRTELHLPTPVTAPEFVPRLSAELAVLARDGVQEARVQVHPAELGPIALQITLDGSAAQVRLAVDSALTRELLEQGMPSLAAALRETGLTLTGGGVFQQPRGQGRDGQASDTPAGRGGESGGDADTNADTGAVAAASAPRRMRHPGQVDVLA